MSLFSKRKMEVTVNNWEGVETQEEKKVIKPVGMVFRGKAYEPPSDSNSTSFSTTTTTTTAINTEDDSTDSDTSNGSAESLNDEKVKEKSRKGKSTSGISSLKNGGKGYFFSFFSLHLVRINELFAVKTMEHLWVGFELKLHCCLGKHC